MSTDPEELSKPLAAFTPPAESVGEALPIHSTSVRIGQGPQNEVVLDDDTVSTHHARLEFVAGGWRLTDLDSKNGTFVDGVRLAPGIPTPLPSHVDVAFGGYHLVFLPNPDADPETAASPAAAAERTPLAERSAFRLPLWLLVLLILFVAALITLFVVFGGDPQTVDPVVDPVTALLRDPLELLAA